MKKFLSFILIIVMIFTLGLLTSCTQPVPDNVTVNKYYTDGLSTIVVNQQIYPEVSASTQQNIPMILKSSKLKSVSLTQPDPLTEPGLWENFENGIIYKENTQIYPVIKENFFL